MQNRFILTLACAAFAAVVVGTARIHALSAQAAPSPQAVAAFSPSSVVQDARSRRRDAYPFFGALAHFQFNPPSEETELGHDAQVGVKLVRMDVSGADVEPSPGHFDFTKLDALIDPIYVHGMQLLPMISQYNAPSWSTGQGGNWRPVWGGNGTTLGDGKGPEDYGVFAGAVTAHLAEKYHVTRVELGNELNLPMYWLAEDGRYANPDGNGQAPFLIAAYKAVHRTPNVTAWPCISNSGQNPAFFIRTISQAGAGYHKGYDGIDVHNYYWHDPQTVGYFDHSPKYWDVFNSFAWFEHQMQENGDPDPRLMITEWGWSSANGTAGGGAPAITEDERAQWTATGLKMMMNDPHIDAETYTGVDTQSNDFWGGFSVFSKEGHLLPSGEALRALALH